MSAMHTWHPDDFRAHDADVAGLIAALRPFATLDENDPPPGIMRAAWRQVVQNARAAIAKATGGAA